MGLVSFDKSQDPESIQINSSVSTIFAMVNSMVGGIILVLPLMTMKSGIITSAIVLSAIGAISCKTFQILIKNLEPQEFDIQEIVQRILGNRWMKFLNAMSSFYLIFVCVLYYYLIVASLYSISVFTITSFTKQNQSNEENNNQSFCCAKPHDITFSQFSETWMTVFLILPMTALLFIKNFKFLVKMSELGIYAIYSYIGFIIYLFISNFKDILYYWDNSYLFKCDLGSLLGSSLLGYQIQTTSIPIMKFNRNQSLNKRDVSLSFLLALVIYITIGLLGGLATLALGKGKINDKETIIDFFSSEDFSPILIEAVYLGHLVSVYPIFWQLAKSRAYEIVFGLNDKPPKTIDKAVNIIFIILCSLMKNVPSINVSTITGLNGAFSCFFLVILIPVCLDIVTMKSRNRVIVAFKSLIHKLGFNSYYKRNQEIEMTQEEQDLNNENNEQLNKKIEGEKSYNWVIYMHILIILIGLVIMYSGIYNSVEDIKEGFKNESVNHETHANLASNNIHNFLNKTLKKH